MTRTAEAYAILRAAYPKWSLDGAQLVVWAKLLEDVPGDELVRAATQHARTSKWPPTVAELRELATPPKMEGIEAWDEIQRALIRYGPDDAVPWSSPAVETAVRAVGGWKTLANGTPIDQIPSVRKRAIDAFDAAQRHGTYARERESAEHVLGAGSREMIGGIGMLPESDET